ncbi:MAG: hypothetical protein HYX76_09370 [Acidobacteria bacterium]|nr:hypothetical protein [Acidobacteriota bacterium]
MKQVFLATMRHLTAEQFVDIVEGREIDDDGTRHLAGCAACRQEVEALRSVLLQANIVEVPEPSPLFWNHLSARVRAAVDETPPSRWWRWSLARVVFAGGAVASLVLVLTMTMIRRPPVISEDAPIERSSASGSTVPSDQGEAVTFDEDEPDWAMVATVAESFDWDDVEAGMPVRPGSAERAIAQLSDEERSELARLLKEALGLPKS